MLVQSKPMGDHERGGPYKTGHTRCWMGQGAVAAIQDGAGRGGSEVREDGENKQGGGWTRELSRGKADWRVGERVKRKVESRDHGLAPPARSNASTSSFLIPRRRLPMLHRSLAITFSV